MEPRPLRSIDFVIPIFNEEMVLEQSVLALHRRLDQLTLPTWRIVIMDNGSTDRGPRIASSLASHLPRVIYERLRVKGRGYALRHTWMRSAADASLYMDVDLSTDLGVIPDFVRLLEAGSDLVVGSRLAKASTTRRCLKRETLSRGYNLLIKALFQPQGFDDAQCGFKAVWLDQIRRVLPRVENNHWFFDTELLLVAEAAGLTINSVPVLWNEDPDTRVNISSTVIEDLRGLARVRRSLESTVGKIHAADLILGHPR